MPSRASAAPAYVYAPELGAEGSELTLSESESHYVAHVCRARLDETLDCTDGQGRVATLRVTTLGRAVRGRVERVVSHERRRPAWLLCGTPEGKRDDWMVEKLAELGVGHWTPVTCERGDWDAGPRVRERWERLAIAALRQSRSAFRMAIDSPIPLRDAVAPLPRDSVRWLAEPAGEPPIVSGEVRSLAAVIGPAGGLTDAEREWLGGEGFQAVSLGASRLRAETAAVAMASIWCAAG